MFGVCRPASKDLGLSEKKKKKKKYPKGADVSLINRTRMDNSPAKEQSLRENKRCRTRNQERVGGGGGLLRETGVNEMRTIGNQGTKPSSYPLALRARRWSPGSHGRLERQTDKRRDEKKRDRGAWMLQREACALPGCTPASQLRAAQPSVAAAVRVSG